eukprot:Awhi_evm1s10851
MDSQMRDRARLSINRALCDPNYDDYVSSVDIEDGINTFFVPIESYRLQLKQEFKYNVQIKASSTCTCNIQVPQEST